MEVRLNFQLCPCGIYGAQSRTETVLVLQIPLFVHYHYNNTVYPIFRHVKDMDSESEGAVAKT